MSTSMALRGFQVAVTNGNTQEDFVRIEEIIHGHGIEPGIELIEEEVLHDQQEEEEARAQDEGEVP